MTVILFRIAAMTISALLAQDAVTQPPSALPAEPAAPAQVAADAKLSQDATIDQILEALHRRGLDLNDFTAEVTLADTDAVVGGSTTRKGSAVYQKKGEGDARIRVVFDNKKVGKKIYNEKTEYLLDNGWLVDRDYKRQTEVRRQVLRPGEKIDLLKLGEGPFPLPIGQPKESVKKLFIVTKVPADPKTDPADTVHVRLVPRPNTQFARKFASIDVWVGTKTEMPERIETLDSNGSTRHTTDLNVKSINAGLKDADFILEPLPGDWDRHDEPYSD